MSKRQAATEEGSEGKAKRYRPSFTDTVKVLAGDEKVEFTVHKDTTCAKSDFFRAACKGEWLSAKKKKAILLPDVRPETFTLYAHWAYSGELDLSIIDYRKEAVGAALDMEIGRMCEARVRHFGDQDTRVRLHLAADFLGDIPLKERVIDMLLEKYVVRGGLHLRSATYLNLVWEGTSTGSGLRKLFLDCITASSVDDVEFAFALAAKKEEVVADLYFDLAVRQLVMIDRGRASSRLKVECKARYYDRRPKDSSQ